MLFSYPEKKKISLGKYEGIMVITQNLQQKEVKGRKGGREKRRKDGGGKKRGKGGRQK